MPIIYKKETLQERRHRLKRVKSMVYVSNIFFILGVFIFSYFVFTPIFKSVAVKPRALNFIKPFPGTVLGLVYSSSEEFYFSELGGSSKNNIEYSRKDAPERFELSIPKLSIKNATVMVDSKELNPKGFLGHYYGTALPGELGNSFIYGHSTLPIFYNPTDYSTIFTKIPDLKIGDLIQITYRGQTLLYKVRIGKELLPSEVNPYGAYYPNMYNKSTITLMTCTPPGTKKNRYIVLAELE
jgi:LPXTG-site transpeptidase (sortase) family protein